MALVASYLPNTNTAQLASDGDTKVDLTFGSMHSNGLGGDCILGFTVTTANFPDLKVEARLNDGPVIFTSGPPSTSNRRFYEQVTFNGLQSGPINNKVTFKIVAGSGFYFVTGAVIWLRLNT